MPHQLIPLRNATVGLDPADVGWPRAEIITGCQHAEELWRRHNRLNRAPDIVQALWSLHFRGDAAPLDAMRQRIDRSGAFLLYYPRALLEQRLTDPQWLLAALLGPGGLLVPGADCQCELPRDHRNARPVVRLPAARSDCLTPAGAAAARAIWRHPGCAAAIADLAVDEAVSGWGYARAVRQAAFEEILARNRQRTFPVHYLVAEIFTGLRGLRLPDGSEVLLEEHGQPCLSNTASQRAHGTRRGHVPFVPGWVIRGESVPLGEGGLELLCDWEVSICDLRCPEIR